MTEKKETSNRRERNRRKKGLVAGDRSIRTEPEPKSEATYPEADRDMIKPVDSDPPPPYGVKSFAVKRARPDSLPSVTIEKQTHCGKIYITITTDSAGLPFEAFVRFGKAGHCGAAIFDATTKLLSNALRSGMDPNEAVKSLGGIGCSRGKRTCMNAVSEALSETLGEASPKAEAKESC